TVIDLSERRSRFVASVTHELKTPLTNIRMYIELLEQGIAGTPEREQEYFSVLNTESTRLSRLINNVLELSRLENRQRHIDLQEGDLREVFKEVETVLGEKIRQEGFALFMDQQAVRPFRYDAEILMLILINLIENSLKFGRQQPLKSITVRAWQEGTSTYIAVTDTGPGIPRQALKKIFRDFYRVKGPLTQTAGGTGIGLALVRKLTHLMNGTVRARNNEGPGCTITISLPFNGNL
ncbi:MAG: HAMP domain-containing histidine kinase, partial [Deltaproteobacteria bacterium]|nr:HAMP domain-containing histidine kinase [Deltaproteobacteria bacterium]